MVVDNVELAVVVDDVVVEDVGSGVGGVEGRLRVQKGQSARATRGLPPLDKFHSPCVTPPYILISRVFECLNSKTSPHLLNVKKIT